MSRLDGAAIVTGGGSDNGAAIAHRLAADGAGVLVADADEQAAIRVAREIAARGLRAAPFQMDAAEELDAKWAVAEAERLFGRLRFAVCNARLTDRVAAMALTRGAFENVLRTNLVGTFVSAQAAARAMAQGPAAERGGRIVTISSVAGEAGGTGRVASDASRGGVHALTRVLAAELASFGIRVNAVAPGPSPSARAAERPRQKAARPDVLAPKRDAQRAVLQRHAPPAEIAKAVAWLCSPEALSIAGRVLQVDGAFRAAALRHDPADGA